MASNPRTRTSRSALKRKGISNQEIVAKFVEAKAIDFGAIGQLVGELGPALSASDLGFRVVLAGRPFIIACLMPAGDLRDLVGELRNVGVGSEIIGEKG